MLWRGVQLEAFNKRLDALNIPQQISQRAREQVVAELLDPKNADALDELRRAITGAPGEPGVVRHATTGQIVMDDAELELLRAEIDAEQQSARTGAASAGGATSTTAAVDDATGNARR